MMGPVKALLLLLLPLAAGAQPLVIEADARYELLGAAELAAGGRSKRFTDPKDEYAKAAKALLAGKDLSFQKSLPRAFDFVAQCDLVDRVTAEFAPATGNYLPDPTVALAGGKEKVEPWLAALGKLNAGAGFPAFFAAQKPGLDARAEPFRAAANDAKVLSAIEAYAGRPFDGSYRVVVSPYFDSERMLNSSWPRAEGGRELRTSLGASAGRKDPEYFFKERLPATLWRQLAHGYWDAKLAAAGLDGRTDGRKEPCFGSWERCAQENVARAVAARLLALSAGEKAAQRFLNDGDQDFYPQMPRLLEKLKAYEADRARYKTLDEYLPRLLDAFPKK